MIKGDVFSSSRHAGFDHFEEALSEFDHEETLQARMMFFTCISLK